jgi:hypothetical protein
MTKRLAIARGAISVRCLRTEGRMVLILRDACRASSILRDACCASSSSFEMLAAQPSHPSRRAQARSSG